MSRRVVSWGVGLAVLGALMLVLGVRAVVDFVPPAGTPQVLTLGQLIDMLTGAGLLVIAVVILLTGIRRHRDQRRHERWVRQHKL